MPVNRCLPWRKIEAYRLPPWQGCRPRARNAVSVNQLQPGYPLEEISFKRPARRPFVPRRRHLSLVPVHRRWRGDRPRLSRWLRSWAVVLLVLLVAPLAALLPPAQRLFFPLHFQDEILLAAQATGVDPSLVAAVALSESGFRPEAVSDQGAVGLMQLLPSTARWAAGEAGLPWQGASSLRRPDTNLTAGAWYLGWLLNRFQGDPVLALAAYNVGQHTVDDWRNSKGGTLALGDLPYPETRFFVRRVLLARSRYRSLYPSLAQ